jgi:hypothetical protein
VWLVPLRVLVTRFAVAIGLRRKVLANASEVFCVLETCAAAGRHQDLACPARADQHDDVVRADAQGVRATWNGSIGAEPPPAGITQYRTGASRDAQADPLAADGYGSSAMSDHGYTPVFTFTRRYENPPESGID